MWWQRQTLPALFLLISTNLSLFQALIYTQESVLGLGFGSAKREVNTPRFCWLSHQQWELPCEQTEPPVNNQPQQLSPVGKISPQRNKVVFTWHQNNKCSFSQRCVLNQIGETYPYCNFKIQTLVNKNAKLRVNTAAPVCLWAGTTRCWLSWVVILIISLIMQRKRN